MNFKKLVGTQIYMAKWTFINVFFLCFLCYHLHTLRDSVSFVCRIRFNIIYCLWNTGSITAYHLSHKGTLSVCEDNHLVIAAWKKLSRDKTLLGKSEFKFFGKLCFKNDLKELKTFIVFIKTTYGKKKITFMFLFNDEILEYKKKCVISYRLGGTVR